MVELLVVIAIIGILAAVVTVSLSDARKKSRDARRIADLQQISLALENYYDSRKGPTGSGTSYSYPQTLDILAAAGFISRAPADPQTGTVYTYVSLGTLSGVCSSYHLLATLENSSDPALSTDADATASTALCTATADQSGVDTTPIYDIKP